MKEFIHKNVLYLAFIQAFAAVVGSLYLSNIMNLPPCVLCWYQRICLYPLVTILAVGILRKDKMVHLYVLPLSIIGLLIAFYHNLLYYKIIPESTSPCIAGISCTTRFFELFGFLTIPLLSLISFGIISACMIIYMKVSRK